MRSTAKKILAALTAFVLASLMASCSNSDSSSASSSDVSSQSDSGISDSSVSEAENRIVFSKDGVSVTGERFFSEAQQISIGAPEDCKVYYTTDGSEPDESSTLYSEPIELSLGNTNFPNCLVLRAKAYHSDGTQSETVTHSFFAGMGIDSRFESLVFSICGNPYELTEAPDGIMYGQNALERGRESERAIYVEAINSDGTIEFEQGAGVRVYGAASRESSIKSMKLYARKSYDENHGKFDTDAFATENTDGGVIEEYDKLVLRNCGNDFQFAFIRDELNQRLAAQAGYSGYEAVMPAVVYLNGEYYGLFWMHESFCDDFFKSKFGDGNGTFELVEGTEQEKAVDEDDAESAAAATEFNEFYNDIMSKDLLDDTVYEELNSKLDVEDYLQNYAFNIYVNNRDWPQNNYKCYRYYAADGEDYGEGSFDGRWRLLFHDTDYCMGLYEQDLTVAYYNNLKHILTPGDERYSPMFTTLMQREDCKKYFLDEITRLMNNTLSADNIIATLEEMNGERYSEMKYFFEHLESLKWKDNTIWSSYGEFEKRTQNIVNFANQRRKFMEKYLIAAFELDENYFSE